MIDSHPEGTGWVRKIDNIDTLENLLTLGDVVERETCTYKGIQKNITDLIDSKSIEAIRNHINSTLGTNPTITVQAGNMVRAWHIEYEPGGWQAVHSHGGDMINIVINFDTVPKNNSLEGYTFSFVPKHSIGKLLYNFTRSVRGETIIFEGDIMHGAYPSPIRRRVLVLDFEKNPINT